MSDSDDDGSSTAADVLEALDKLKSLPKETQENIKRLLFTKLVGFYAAGGSGKDGYVRVWIIESKQEQFKDVNPEGYRAYIAKKFEFLLELIEQVCR